MAVLLVAPHSIPRNIDCGPATPSVETPGYSRMSLRDWYAIDLPEPCLIGFRPLGTFAPRAQRQECLFYFELLLCPCAQVFDQHTQAPAFCALQPRRVCSPGF